MGTISSRQGLASWLGVLTAIGASFSVGCPGPEPQASTDGTGGSEATASTGSLATGSSSASSGPGGPTVSASSAGGQGQGGEGVGGAGGLAGTSSGPGGAGGAGGSGTGGTGGAPCGDILGDPDNCGECGHVCSSIGVQGVRRCEQGSCTPKCRIGRLDRNRPGLEEPDDGCEVIAKRVFVTDEVVSANLGGAEGFDQTCQGLADGLPGSGTWMAWVSGPLSVEERFTPSPTPYVLLDNTVIAESWEDLVTNGPAEAIHLTEAMNDLVADEAIPIDVRQVWTGTLPDGSPSDDRCGDWESNGDAFGTVGLVMYPGEVVDFGVEAWSSYLEPFCNIEAHIYCFEQ